MVSPLDFSGINQGFSNLADAFQTRRERRSLSEIGEFAQSGDFESASRRAFDMGNIGLGVRLSELGQLRDTRAREQQAQEGLNALISTALGQPARGPAPAAGAPGAGLPRGIRNRNPGNLEASAFTRGQPGFVESDGRFGRFETPEQGLSAMGNLLQSYGRRGFNTINRIVSRFAPAADNNDTQAYVANVARMTGIDPNQELNLSDPQTLSAVMGAMIMQENGQLPFSQEQIVAAVSPGATVAPGDVQTAPQIGSEQGATIASTAPQPVQVAQAPSQREQALNAIMLHPQSTAGQRQWAQSQLDALQQPDDPDLLSPEAMRQQMILRGISRPSVTVEGPPPENNIRKALDKKEGELWADFLTVGAAAQGRQQDFEVMGELLKMAPQGPIQGRLAQALPGFSSAGDAVQAIVSRLAPTFRVEGSGSTSDIEYAGMLRSLPSLVTRPEGNRLILQMMQAKAQVDIDRSNVINQFQSGQIDAPEARRQLAEIGNRSIVTPEMRKALGDIGPSPDPIELPAVGQKMTINGLEIERIN